MTVYSFAGPRDAFMEGEEGSFASISPPPPPPPHGVSRKRVRGCCARGNFDHTPNQGREITHSCIVVMNQERILRLKFVSASL